MDENKSFDYIPKLTLDPNAATAAAVQEAPAAVVEQAVICACDCVAAIAAIAVAKNAVFNSFILLFCFNLT